MSSKGIKGAEFDGPSVAFGTAIGIVVGVACTLLLALFMARPTAEEQLRAVRGAFPGLEVEVTRVAYATFVVRGPDGCMAVEVSSLFSVHLKETGMKCP